MNSFLQRVLPYIYLGIVVVVFFVGIVILSYLLMIGALVGLGLYLLVRIKERFFDLKVPSKANQKSGRIIDYHDNE